MLDRFGGCLMCDLNRVMGLIKASNLIRRTNMSGDLNKADCQNSDHLIY